MTVQFVEFGGQKVAMLPIADYERLLEIAEDKADFAAAVRAEERRRGGEEYVPADLVDRLLAGESALKVWRVYRGMTLKQLAGLTGISIAYLHQVENGIRRGSPRLWRALANALNVSADDILPETA